MPNWKDILKGIPRKRAVEQLSGALVVELAKVQSAKETKDPAEDGISSESLEQRVIAPADVSLFGRFSEDARASGMHEPVLLRNHFFALSLARQVVNPKGEIDRSALTTLIKSLDVYGHALDPLSLVESEVRLHAKSVLKRLMSEKKLSNALMSINAPTTIELAQKRILETLGRKSGKITDAEARIAALAMILSYFRQNVGSCFATAPGIIIQRFEPERILEDLKELFQQGKMSRYFAGIGLEVPFSRSAGVGDFNRPMFAESDQIPLLIRQVAFSPAFQASMQFAEIFQRESVEERVQKVVAWCVPLAHEYIEQSPNASLSIEQLIRWVALGAFGLKEKDLKRHQQRPDPVIHDGILVQNPFLDTQAPECDACLQAIETMTSVFKRFGQNPLLKVWEYTLASLTDHQSSFTKTNLYHSLGLDPSSSWGVGQVVENSIQKLLEHYNDIVVQNKHDHRRWVYQLNAMEQRMKTVSEELFYTLKMEHSNIKGKLSEIAIVAQNASRVAQYLSRLFNELMGYYFDWFADYFQEIYDPDLQVERADEFADSPAGFRLYFKNAREDSSQWLAVTDEKSFLLSLQEFFRSTEPLLISEQPKEVWDAIRELVTEVMNQLQQPRFIEMAKLRLAQSNFGSAASNHARTPWAYVSGGSVDKLLAAYLRMDTMPLSENPALRTAYELFEFLIKHMRIFRESRIVEPLFAKEMLLCSPTHAFVFQPNTPIFEKCWHENGDIEKWLEVHYLVPTSTFFERITLSKDMQSYLVLLLMQKIGTQATQLINVLSRSISSSPMSASEFAKSILSNNLPNRSKAALLAFVTEIYYQSLPLHPVEKIPDVVVEIASNLGIQDGELSSIANALLQHSQAQHFIGNHSLHAIVLQSLMLHTQKILTAEDWQLKVADTMRALHYLAPTPMMFADSNWFGWKFAFLGNPVTGKLELWQTNRLGMWAKPWPIEWGRQWQLFLF